MTTLQDIKKLIDWAGPHQGLPPSSALPSILALLDTAPACHETVFHALHSFLTGALTKLFQGNVPNKPFAQRYTGGGGAGGREREREADTNSLNEDVRVISAHMLSVLQKNSVQWAPVITKWTIDILRATEPTMPRSVQGSSAALDNIPVLETLLAVRLKLPALKHLSSLLSSSWLFLDLSTCNLLLDELILGGGEASGGKKGGDVDWVLALVGMQDPERAILVSLRHLAHFYATISSHQQNISQQLVLHRAGKLAEFISFRFPVHASSAILLFLDDTLFLPSQNPILQGLEDKIGFLACLGSAFPRLFDSAFGTVLERVEVFANSTSALPTLAHNYTRTLLETLLSERLHNIATSSYLPRIFAVLHSISSHTTQAMETDNVIPLHSLTHSLLSHILDTICDISFNSKTKTNEPVLWGVVGQWRIFWDLGELGQASVLAALSGLDRTSQAATAHNVHTIAGAVLAHALIKTEPEYTTSKSGHDPYPSLIAVLSVFDSQPTLLAHALDCVMQQVAPNPHLCCVLFSRFDDFISYSNHSPAIATLSINIAMHWEKILTFTTHPHAPLRLSALHLLRCILPILYSQLPSHLAPPSSSPSSQQNQLLKPLTYPATNIFHPKSILKIKMEVLAFQNIIRALTKTFLASLKSDTLDFEYIESILSTIAVSSSLSPIHFGLVVTLLLEFIFSDQASDVIREATSTPLQPMNCLPRPVQENNNNKETKRLLEMNYTRHWRAQIHNRLGSGIFIPKRQRLTDSDAPRGLSAISVRNNNIHNDLEDGIHLNGHATDPDLDLYGGDRFALRRDAVSSLLGRCSAQQPPSYFSTLTDQYLMQLVTQAPVPTYEQYAEVLPKVSPFDRDIFLRKVFKQNPILLDILELIADEPLEFIKVFEVIKGILANTIAHWNAEPGSSTIKNSHYNFTVRFITILGKAQWVPHPLSCCGEIMNVMTPSELSMLLITMWNFVRDFPPIPDSFTVSKSGRPKRIFASPAKLSVFIRPMRTIAHAHIVELGALYRAYFQTREPGGQ